jgi:metal-dependent amidase/aminoacylase/carboxypeptidase family protein
VPKTYNPHRRRNSKTDVSPTPPKTAHIHGISGCTTSLIRGTRPIREKKMATPGELHHLHNPSEEIPDGTTV